jgi:hypothetical protein
MAQQEGFAPQLGCVPRPAQVAEGGIGDGGDGDWGEGAQAHQPRPWHGVSTIGLEPSARLLGNQGGGDAPASVAFLPQVPRDPVATGTSFVDEDERLALCVQLPDELVDSTLPRPKRAEGDARRPVCLGNIGNGDGRLMDLHANGERARLGQG